MKKITKKLSSLFALGALGASLFSMPAASAKEEISVWAWDPKFNIRALEIAADYYAKENSDVSLKIEENAQNDIVQKLNTAMSAGVTDSLPNIVLIEDYRAQSFLSAYPDTFIPLNDYFKTEDFAPYKIEATSVGDKHYGIPFDTGVTGLYVRTDLLKEAGYSTDDLQDITWNQLAEIGEKVKEKTGVKLLSVDLNDLGLLRAMINGSGSWYTKEDGKTPYIADNAALKEAFTTFKAMYEKDLVNVHNDWAQMLEAFNTGKVFTVPQGNWITPSVTQAEDQAGKWAVVPWPKQEIEGSVHASNLGGASFYVINKKGSEAAADFLAKTFASNADFYSKLITEIGALGTYLPVQKTDVYDTKVDYFGGQAIYKDFAKWSAEIPSVNYGIHTYAIEDILTAALQQFLSGGDLDQVFKDAQAQAESQLNQ
ncbi:ABC transporter substrate-binding protein [Tuanshanicoccus lijuaniae]|uniref:ABC transporter substrate-binding protein n=1 Tax=Aerococcaceae bacterium zg-1292 TaxID=2774330 RepID=UPI001BD837F8|nr:carbohydrate ABC transporter substrate-binding protein [Aerococcaceae bacterium zg-A91]MBS4457478.1 carbohydrate ABC transporter substrate-binding protein [Aerococcaceae bacterium zg-BR33]